MGYVPGYGDIADKYRHQPGMKNYPFKKSILVSALWHLTVFSLFSFSSGDRLSRLNYPDISSFGRILDNYGFTGAANPNAQDIRKFFFSKANTVSLDKNRRAPSLSSYYLKPQVALTFSGYKSVMPAAPASIRLPKKESVVMFYPQLPYHFLIYFKDRQAVHIELAFNIISHARTNSIIIKRKISSGNLEADLLTMRYLSHYLFIQQMGFPANTWQSVKIELSPKND
jgi:hypothetical protein